MEQPSLFSSLAMSVADLTRYLRALFESDPILQNVWVEGEISNLSQPSSGHIYFTLKDSSASLRCVIWRSTASRLRFILQNGQAVEVHGAVGVYEPAGQYQIYVDALRPVGEGRLYQEFLRLKAKLETDGLFDEDRKRPLPERPRVIGIVTSPTGAALQDMLNTLRQRFPLVEVILAPTAVQGEEAPAAIAAALKLLELEQPDVILVARGGGSLEDLWAFNDEHVVRAIADCSVPVITGIGHETDFTLADFAADRRAPTPTGAAVMAVPDAADLRQEVEDLRRLLENSMAANVSVKRVEIQTLSASFSHASPYRRIQDWRQRLDELEMRSSRAKASTFALLRARQVGLGQRLAAVSPFSVLERGYAIVQHSDGAVVRSAKDVATGEKLGVYMRDGHFSARVEELEGQF